MAPSCELVQFSDRLFFTTFPAPTPSHESLNCPTAHPPTVRARPKTGAPVSPDDDAKYHYFTIDDSLVYLSFFEDWGPLNLAMVFKACILIHELLEDKELTSHRLVLYSSNDARRKANAALLLALYVMIVQRRAPWEAFHPLAELEFMPFRDAGRGRSDFHLSIQDCLWGVWKAIQNGLCDMNEFSVDDYEFYEKVENGDWNWITPSFIAFASPVDAAFVRREKQRTDGTLPASVPATELQRRLPTPFTNCLEYFEKRNVKVVVRLNNPLYDKTVFTERGIEHLELYFDDGTNPTDEIVRKFIQVSDAIIESGGVVAVHCKAGLGRTGTLIGAYLIWKYGFTATEAIAFMRIVRPGSVVGPQQQYMYMKQLEWSKWAAVDEMRRIDAARAATAAPVPVSPATPPAEEGTLPSKMEGIVRTATPVQPAPALAASFAVPPVTPSKHAAAASRGLGAGPPQPRKTPNGKRVAVDSEEEAEIDGILAAAGPSGSRVPKRAAHAASPKHARALSSDTRRLTRSSAATTRTPGIKRAPRPVNGAASRPLRPGGSPTPPSRLPTLVASKRRMQLAQPPLPDLSVLKAAQAAGPDAWMSTSSNTTAVMAPRGTGKGQSERPVLRSVRRRRSSFSSADVVA